MIPAGGLTSPVLARGQIRPRAIFCVNEHAYRRRDVAEEVCAGRFSHCGLTLELGPRPDWLGAAFPPDEEWWIDLRKFPYGRDLASAFCQTGERRFLDAWERLVESWIDQVPAGSDATDETARRIQNWVYAWALFASAPRFEGLRDGLDRRLLASIQAQADHVRSGLTPQRNHRTLELYALFTVALALPALPAAGELVEFAIAELYRNLLDDFHPDGVHIEQSTHYHLVVLRSFVGLRENARRFGLALPDGFDRRLERACEFAMHCHRPDGAIPALSDADGGSYPELLALTSGLLGRPDFLYAATEGAAGSAPRSRYVSFPHGGYFVQRSGWGGRGGVFAHERFLIFDCGPVGAGGHGHYDALSFEAAAGGRALVVDPGRYTYSEHEPDASGVARNLRHWFKGTAGHNTVRVDGLDQTPYRPGKPKGGVAQARLLGRASTHGLDIVHGEVRSPCYEAVHRRRVVFVGDEYWLVEDELDAHELHRYELRFHLSPGAAGDVALERSAGAHVVRAPGLALALDARLDTVLEPGWVSPLYGVKHPAPVLLGVLDGVARATLVTLVAPLGTERPHPRLRVADAAGTTVVEVCGAAPGHGVRDVVAWGPAGSRLALGAVRCRADAAWLRESPEGDPLAFRACGASGATWAATTEPVATRPAGDGVGWDRAGLR